MPDAGLVFLTGATGFIGSRLARRLAQAGHRLRCLVRPASPTSELESIGAEIVRGHVTDEVAMERALDDVVLAYHLAAIYDIGVVDARELERVNVGGTHAFLNAIERARVPRAVYVSTTAALGPVRSGVGSEESVHDGHFRSVYERTKTQAHGLAKSAQARGVPVIIVCPANVYGPGDRGPHAQFMRDLIRGRLPGLLSRSGWFSYVHVDDVVDGLVRAGVRGRAGQTYVLGGEHLAVNEFARRVAEQAGEAPPRLRFPASLARLTGTALDLVTRLTGKRFSLSREGVDMVAGWRWLHGDERARRELGWSSRPLSDGLPETVQWLAGPTFGGPPR